MAFELPQPLSSAGIIAGNTPTRAQILAQATLQEQLAPQLLNIQADREARREQLATQMALAAMSRPAQQIQRQQPSQQVPQERFVINPKGESDEAVAASFKMAMDKQKEKNIKGWAVLSSKLALMDSEERKKALAAPGVAEQLTEYMTSLGINELPSFQTKQEKELESIGAKAKSLEQIQAESEARAKGYSGERYKKGSQESIMSATDALQSASNIDNYFDIVKKYGRIAQANVPGRDLLYPEVAQAEAALFVPFQFSRGGKALTDSEQRLITSIGKNFAFGKIDRENARNQMMAILSRNIKAQAQAKLLGDAAPDILAELEQIKKGSKQGALMPGSKQQAGSDWRSY